MESNSLFCNDLYNLDVVAGFGTWPYIPVIVYHTMNKILNNTIHIILQIIKTNSGSHIIILPSQGYSKPPNAIHVSALSHSEQTLTTGRESTKLTQHGYMQRGCIGQKLLVQIVRMKKWQEIIFKK